MSPLWHATAILIVFTRVGQTQSFIPTSRHTTVDKYSRSSYHQGRHELNKGIKITSKHYKVGLTEPMSHDETQHITHHHNPNNHPSHHKSTQRRNVLKLSAAMAFALLKPIKSYASDFTQTPEANPTTEAIRRSAAKIPGYGQPDIYYPPNFAGRWKVSRDIIHGAGAEPVTVEYEVRYLTADDGHVIADRAFNELNLLGAENAPVRTVDWDSRNPNVLTVLFENNTSREVKVTKRKFDDDGMGFSSSEYRRVSNVGQNGIPIISASRVLSKWRVAGDGVIEGIELLYEDSAMAGDPMSMSVGKGGAPGNTGARLIEKSRLKMIRLGGSD